MPGLERAIQELTQVTRQMVGLYQARAEPTQEGYLKASKSSNATGGLGGQWVEASGQVSTPKEAAEETEGQSEEGANASTPPTVNTKKQINVTAYNTGPFKRMGAAWQRGRGEPPEGKTRKDNFLENFLDPYKAKREQYNEEVEALTPAGEQGDHGSEPDSQARQQLSQGQVAQRHTIPGGQQTYYTEHEVPGGSEPSASLPGATKRREQALREEEGFIPQYGEIKADWIFRMLAKKYMPDEDGNEGNAALAGTYNYLSELAPQAAAYKQMIMKYAVHPAQRVLDAGYAGQEVGASLGYSQQEGALGTPAYILGMRNPLSLTSPAARQGLGQKYQSLQHSILGTGISYDQAQGLRESLAGEGFSNQQTGFMGLYTGGEQENLATALEPTVKAGVSPQVATGFANVTRYGNASIQELQNSLKGLGSTAKTLKFNMDETAKSMQQFAATSEQSGGTPIHGLNAYKQIAGATGVDPNLIHQVASTPFGQAMGIGMGVFPGTLGAAPGGTQVATAVKTVQQAAKFFPGHASKHTNVNGEVEEESAEENKLAMIQAVFGIPAEMAKTLLKHGKEIEHGSANLHHTKAMQRWYQEGQVAENETFYMKAHTSKTAQAGHWKVEENQMQNKRAKLENELASAQHSGNNQHAVEIESQLYGNHEAGSNTLGLVNEIEERHSKIHDFKNKVHEDAQRTSKKEEKANWEKWNQSRKHLEEGGISGKEIHDAEKEGNWTKRWHKIEEDQEKHDKKISQQGGGENGQIELGPLAKEFFTLQYPKQAAEASKAGGASTASGAAAAFKPGSNPVGEYIAKIAGQQQEKIETNQPRK